MPHHGRFARPGGSGHDKLVLNLGRIVVRRAAVCFRFVSPRCSSGFFAGFFVYGILLGSRRCILCRVFFGFRGRGILTRAGFRFLRCSDHLFRRLSLCCQRPGGGQGQAEGNRQKQAQYTFFHQVFLRLTSVVGNKPQLFGCGFGFAAPFYTQFF